MCTVYTAKEVPMAVPTSWRNRLELTSRQEYSSEWGRSKTKKGTIFYLFMEIAHGHFKIQPEQEDNVQTLNLVLYVEFCIVNNWSCFSPGSMHFVKLSNQTQFGLAPALLAGCGQGWPRAAYAIWCCGDAACARGEGPGGLKKTEAPPSPSTLHMQSHWGRAIYLKICFLVWFVLFCLPLFFLDFSHIPVGTGTLLHSCCSEETGRTFARFVPRGS